MRPGTSITLLLGVLLAAALPTAANAQSGVTLSATIGAPGDSVRLTVHDPGRMVDRLPLAVQLRPAPTFADWPCDGAGTRFLGRLERADDGEIALTFVVPWVQPGPYQIVGATDDRRCVGLGGEEGLPFTVSPDAPLRLPQAELVTVGARSGADLPGCGSWRLDGSEGGDDCGPYEYAPLAGDPVRLVPGSMVVFGISQNWRYGRWRLSAIREDAIVAGLEPPDGQRELARGDGGTRTVQAALPATPGAWRLFLTFEATRGPHAVSIDRPSVFAVELGLPDTSTTAPAGARGLARPVIPPIVQISLGLALIACCAMLLRRPRVGP